MAAIDEVVVRDVRMNRMDTETRMVHERLEQWGKWAKDGEVRAWPSNTLLGRYIEQHDGAHQRGSPPVSMPDHIAVVDAAVCRLVAIDRGVVQTYYLRWEPIEVMARRHKMRVRQFQNVLRRARWRILGFIDAAENNLRLGVERVI